MLSSNFSKPDLHLLHVFIVVVDSKGFSAAQAALNVSTSTISRQISDLEIRLGMRLCQRGRMGFRVTDKGNLVYNAAKKLFASLGEFSETVNGTRGKLVGKLSVGIVDNWIYNESATIVEALRSFVSSAPDVSIDLHSLAPDDLEFGVFDGLISMGIGVFHTHKPGLIYKEIGEEVIGLYCGEEHPLYNVSNEKEISKILKNTLFARRAYLNEEKIAPITQGLESNADAHQIEGVAILILTGHYVGYLPQSFAESWVKDGRMKSVGQGLYDIPAATKLITKRGHKPSLIQTTFIDYLLNPEK